VSIYFVIWTKCDVTYSHIMLFSFGEILQTGVGKTVLWAMIFVTRIPIILITGLQIMYFVT